eukprot:scaffold69174_cov63-Phaeocystis_antarctica.AAC.1
MDVIQACAVGCGEAKQLVGAARFRDLSTERTPVDGARGRRRRTPEGLRGWHTRMPRQQCRVPWLE